MESYHWPGTLKSKKLPLATQSPYFRLGGGSTL
jgi:hypothetical protein